MITWIKTNKLAALVIVILLLLLVKNSRQSIIPQPLVSRMTTINSGYSGGAGGVGIADQKMMTLPVQEAAPTQTANRLVVQESQMSMVVANVRQTSDKIVEYAKSVDGYMINTSLTNPEEAPFATVSIRIPSDKLQAALDHFRSLALKVTSENVLGTDVTDQYVDIQARLETLNKTKAKFEEIMTKATAVQDILTVQRELVNLQDQIDSLKGQQQYLEQTARLAKMTVYLSTDEFALPYAPTNQFRPEVIFKQAVRSLVGSARNLAGMAIWIIVYGVIWVPVGVIGFLIWRRVRTKVS